MRYFPPLTHDQAPAYRDGMDKDTERRISQWWGSLDQADRQTIRAARSGGYIHGQLLRGLQQAGVVLVSEGYWPESRAGGEHHFPLPSALKEWLELHDR